ncbi:MAG: helix-turn-helix domain-containing protein [Reichenbachiella sp.]|uniref:helix-turn-helix domain-containing protein n=1 Tax=Reichenbachiella sp. TaxID=2184521 RepID=UPI0032674279
MEHITFEKLPIAVQEIQNRLSNIENLLSQKHTSVQKIEDELLTVKGVADFLQLSVPTIYGLISKGELPVMKRSKRCYFSKKDIMDYLKKGKRKSTEQISTEADQYLHNK